MSAIATSLYDLSVEVEYDYTPGEPEVRYYAGKRGGCPNGDGHPGCDAEVDILAVWLENGDKRIDIADYLPATAIEDLKEACMEEMKEQANSAAEDRAERAWEASR